LAAGTRSATLALAEASGRWDAEDVSTTAVRQGESFVLSGTKSFVVDGHTADLILVAARVPGSAGARGLSLFAVPADADRLSRRALPTLDMTRRLAEIRLDGVRVPASALLGEEGEAWSALSETLDLAAVALAA